MTEKIEKIVIATGGTGGHIFPAYSLAKHFIDRKIKVVLTTDERGLRFLEDLSNIKISKIQSSTIFNKNLFQLIVSIFVISFSFCKSIIFLIKEKPNLVFGMGGYSSFTVCLASKIIGIPVIIYENNLYIGKTNRYLLKYAKKIFISTKELQGIPEKFKNKICVVGNIIRKEIINFRNNFNISKETKELKILILGGSQAAKVFAEELPKIFKECIDNNIHIKIYQQCLPEQKNSLISYYDSLNIQNEIFTFSNNILDYFSKTNLAITRSGSSMLAELINAKIPLITVPLPSSADGHQLKNAIHYEKKGYSYLIEEKDLNSKLFNLIKKINGDRSLLDQMANKQSQHTDKLVYENIEKQLKKLVNEKY